MDTGLPPRGCGQKPSQPYYSYFPFSVSLPHVSSPITQHTHAYECTTPGSPGWPSPAVKPATAPLLRGVTEPACGGGGGGGGGPTVCLQVTEAIQPPASLHASCIGQLSMPNKNICTPLNRENNEHSQRGHQTQLSTVPKHQSTRDKLNRTLKYQRNILTFKSIPKHYRPSATPALIIPNSSLSQKFEAEYQKLFFQHLNEVITHNTINLELENSRMKEIIR